MAILLFFTPFAFIFIAAILNADLYGRMDENTQVFLGRDSTLDALVVIHRLISDENAAEVSVMLSARMYSPVGDSISSGKLRLKVAVYDGSSSLPFTPLAIATLDSSARIASNFTITTSSQRFIAPVIPSVNGFPFDEISIEPLIVVNASDGQDRLPSIHVLKTVPGRLLRTQKQNTEPIISLVRSQTEIALVLTTSVAFLVISLIVTRHIVAHAKRLTGLEELLTVAGFLIATAGFRDLVGVSRASGTSALEIFVFGGPVALLTAAISYSTLTRHKKRT
jgi:hypothetical protein